MQFDVVGFYATTLQTGHIYRPGVLVVHTAQNKLGNSEESPFIDKRAQYPPFAVENLSWRDVWVVHKTYFIGNGNILTKPLL